MRAAGWSRGGAICRGVEVVCADGQPRTLTFSDAVQYRGGLAGGDLEGRHAVNRQQRSTPNQNRT